MGESCIRSVMADNMTVRNSAWPERPMDVTELAFANDRTGHKEAA